MPSSASGPRARTITESREGHLRTPRTARYRVLGEPDSAREVWFVLHGYRQLAERFSRRFGGLPGLGEWRAVVAPEALSRFYIEDEAGQDVAPHDADSRVGATWMTRADRDHEIRDYVEYLDGLAALVLSPSGVAEPGPIGAGGRRIVVLGFSQGAETASRWATYGRIRPDELVLWGGGLAVDLEASRAAESLAATRIRLVVGRGDRWGGERAAESERWLRERGLGAERVHYEGGHIIAPDVLAEHWGE